jgi:hypothetical protein
MLSGAALTKADLSSLPDNEKCLLLVVADPDGERAASPLGRYLRQGRRAGFTDRFKCRTRSPWYLVPGIRTPHAFLSYMSHRSPRVVLNQAGVTSTNLVHQVRFLRPADARNRASVAALHSSPCLLSFEVEGRSYGGGVLKLETREAERVQLPRLTPRLIRSLSDAFGKVDDLVRGGQHDLAAAVVDDRLLAHGLLGRELLTATRLGLQQLRDRRALRGRTNARWR